MNITDQFKKIRLGYNSTNQYHRQILLGFMNQYATSGIDVGYDAVSIDDIPNDMYFLNNGTKLNIQGDGYFDPAKIFPLGVRNEVAGTVSFVIDGKANFSDSQNFYIYDHETGLHHNITTAPFQIELESGTFDNRFSLCFQALTTLSATENEQLTNSISIIHSQANHMLNIKNQSTETTINKVELYNIMGQKVTDWKVESQNQTNMEFPITGISSGTYVVQLTTNAGPLSKKIVVNAVGDSKKAKKTNTVLCEDQ
ncbi:T9SS type A sorting domain-containing protein [Flavobacterium sp. XGLA_31]|uniref:T9SS type A sorting domain-containing protein n=1 Tax=Flavobacterium sp. XGLA_31 TaxID=3447666 RepID=UPI003F3436C0